ncbi:MAG TPA: PspA/IM30 family protein [Longimicrobiaceae bacterium]|nr:PspA/IM30 family protein [Longimicrobiaceae bacterium]
MGIFNKLSTLVRSNLNDLIARAEDPEKMLNQVILDMREQLTKAKQEVAVAIADERRLKAQVEEEFKQSQDWERRAMLAVRQDRDDLARQALMRQQEHGERAQALHDTWQKHAAETDKLKDALRQLNTKIEEARRKKNLLVAQQKRAQAQKRIHETMSGLSDKSAFEAFDRMAERIQDNERRALASAEVSEELSGDPLEREFAALDKGGGDADMRLLDLKQKMGMLPPAPPAGSRALPGGDQQRLGAGAAPGQGQAQPGGQSADGTQSFGGDRTQALGPDDTRPMAPAQAPDHVRDAELLSEFEALEEEERGRP